jgi:hypothetical protein
MDAAEEIFRGGCLCGAVRYEAQGPATQLCFCHCESCRRAAGAPGVPWATFQAANFKLTKGALAAAETADFDGEPFRVVDAVHLTVIALATGRAKDLTRILALLDAGAVTREQVTALAARHGLADAWNGFVRRFLDDAR